VYVGGTQAGTPIVTSSGIAVAATESTPPRVQFTTPIPLVSPTTDTVCVAFSTSTSKGELLDPAPDLGCFPFVINSDISGATRFK
jgi:hypothetical protein